jgi:hypothetical protein
MPLLFSFGCGPAAQYAKSSDICYSLASASHAEDRRAMRTILHWDPDPLSGRSHLLRFESGLFSLRTGHVNNGAADCD